MVVDFTIHHHFSAVLVVVSIVQQAVEGSHMQHYLFYNGSSSSTSGSSSARVICDATCHDLWVMVMWLQQHSDSLELQCAPTMQASLLLKCGFVSAQLKIPYVSVHRCVVEEKRRSSILPEHSNMV